MFTKNASGNIVSVTLGGSGGGSGLSWSSVPASASATGTAGQIAYDANYQYICVATNTWIRTVLGAWTKSPLELSNLSLWLDASDSASVTTVSGSVSQWSDKSGNGNHVTQSDSGSRPPYETAPVNGLNAIYFGGPSTTHRLTRSSFSVATPTVFTVFKLNSSYNIATTTVLWDTFTSDRAAAGVSDQNSGLFSFQRSDVTNAKAITGSALSKNKAYVTACVSDATGHQVWLNGVKGSDATAGTTGFTGMSIGNLRGSPSPIAAEYTFYGHICEMIVYSSKKTDSERAGIEAYLTKKWGIS
jgi:hypothetical protein